MPTVAQRTWAVRDGDLVRAGRARAMACCGPAQQEADTVCLCGARVQLFHTSCLSTWLSKKDTCPSCRSVLVVEEEDDDSESAEEQEEEEEEWRTQPASLRG